MSRLEPRIPTASALGVHQGYKYNQYRESARKVAEENEVCKNIVAKINGYQWDSGSIRKLIDILDKAIAPLQQIVQEEKGANL